MNGTTLSKRNKRRFHIAAIKYVLKNHSKPDNDFQAAMNIAVYKAFVAGCEYVYSKFINKNDKNNLNNTITKAGTKEELGKSNVEKEIET